MTDYTIVPTQVSDLPFIYWMFDQAIAYQRRKRYPVWEAYDQEVLQADIAAGQQFKIMEGTTLACIFSICYRDSVVWREKD
ncbi:MAG: GNAT family N-acetyltransferase, partial [Bacteroidota bacterium]